MSRSAFERERLGEDLNPSTPCAVGDLAAVRVARAASAAGAEAWVDHACAQACDQVRAALAAGQQGNRHDARRSTGGIPKVLNRAVPVKAASSNEAERQDGRQVADDRVKSGGHVAAVSPLPRRRLLLARVAAGLGSALLPASGHTQSTPPPPRGDAFTRMYTDPRFATWASMVELALLAPDAEGNRPYTVFAPTEAAFGRYPRLRRELVPMRSDVEADPMRLKRVVQAHVLLGLHPLAELRGRLSQFQSIAGTPLLVDGTDLGGALRVEWRNSEGMHGTAPLASPPVEASNGLVYPLDDVTLS